MVLTNWDRMTKGGLDFVLCVKPIASIGKEQRHYLCRGEVFMFRSDCLRLRRFASNPLTRHS